MQRRQFYIVALALHQARLYLLAQGDLTGLTSFDTTVLPTMCEELARTNRAFDPVRFKRTVKLGLEARP